MFYGKEHEQFCNVYVILSPCSCDLKNSHLCKGASEIRAPRQRAHQGAGAVEKA